MCIVHRYKHLYLFLLILYFLPLFLLLLRFYFLKVRHFLCVCPPFNLFQYTYIHMLLRLFLRLYGRGFSFSILGGLCAEL